MRYFIHLSYDGSNYQGWQRQKNTRKTVQEVIENILFKLFKKEVIVYGCGRTDSGVHASQYILHINLNELPEFDLKFRMNKNLPAGISVFEIIKVKENQHARYDPIARTYDYFIHLEKDPVLYKHSSFYESLELDFDLMKKAATLILRTNDFRPLCKQPDLYKNTLCEIKRSELFVNEQEGRLRFSITANRFLRGMVRYCVFFLLEVGRGKLTLDEFEQILKQEKTEYKKKPAFPNGLFLSKVEYSFLKLNNSHQLIRMLKVGLD